MANCSGKCGPFQVRKFSLDTKAINRVGDPTPKPPGNDWDWPAPKNDDVEKAFKTKIASLEQPRSMPETKTCADVTCKCRTLTPVYTQDEVQDTIRVQVPFIHKGTTYTYTFEAKVGRMDGVAEGVCSDPPGQTYVVRNLGQDEDLGFTVALGGPRELTPQLLAEISEVIRKGPMTG
jgi:hypothetical protein